MRRTDIKVGGEYRLLVGTQGGEKAKKSTWGDNYRCIVMDTTGNFANTSNDRYHHDSLWHSVAQAKAMGTAAGESPRRVWATRHKNNRIFVAVEIPILEQRVVETITPDEYRALTYTDQRDWHGVRTDGSRISFSGVSKDTVAFERSEWFTIEKVWLPFAPLTKDIIEPWSDFEATKAEEKERARLSAIASEKAKVIQEAENQRKREAAEEVTRQNQRRQAVSKERYEVRTLPTLIEILGEAPQGFHAQWQENSVATVTFTLEQVEKLVSYIIKKH